MDERDHNPDSPHDGEHPEPLGPITPDDDSPLGHSPDAHDDLNAHDFPKGHPSRPALERGAAAGSSR